MKKEEKLFELLKEIKQLQEELKKMGNRNDFSSPEIVKKSQELDEKLNEYNKMINNN